MPCPGNKISTDSEKCLQAQKKFQAGAYDCAAFRRYAFNIHLSMINVTFSKFVKMNGRQWEVNFRKVPGTSSSFYADTPDLQGHRFQFVLNKSDQAQWELKGASLPQWFGDHLPQLITAVEAGVEEYRTKYSSVYPA